MPDTTEDAVSTLHARRGRRVLEFLRRRTADFRWDQLKRLVNARAQVFDRLQEIPNRMQKLTNQVRLLLDLVDDYWSGTYRDVPWYSLGIAVATAIYFLSPSDFIPDYLPGIGHLDDLLLLGVAIRILERDLRAYARFKGRDPADYF